MKKIVILLLIFFPIFSYSQNVGIGTTVPETKLNIVGTGSNPAIPGGPSGALLRLGISSNQEGIDLGKMSVSPFSAWLQSGLNGTIPDPLTLQPLGGNVGIGTVSPAEKLDVNGNSLFTGTMNINGNMRLQGLNLFEFGAGILGKEINAGKIGYNAFGQNALTFVGAGTNGTNRAVYFYAEGGTTFNGPVNVGGTVQLNGNPGTAGQVLTSNGSSDPTWQAINPNPQIGCEASTNSALSMPALTQHKINFVTEVFDDGNLFDATTDEITIPVTGVYHFDVKVNFFSAPAGNYQLYLDDNTSLADGYFSLSYVTTTTTPSDPKISVQISVAKKFSAGETVLAHMFQNSGATQNYTAFISCFRVY